MAELNNSSRKNVQINIPDDLLNDLSSRFIINVPEEERVDLIRLCFQIELAHWFYLDFYCEENSKLPKCTLKDFIRIIFGHIPFLKKYLSQVDTVITDWKEYKSAVPTCGAILLDNEMKNVLLVQSYYSKASWGFPKGKINIDEAPHICAIREVLEETGFDITSLIFEDEFIEHNFNGQIIRLYIITGIPLNTKFQPKTRNEIKCAEWFLLNELPSGKKDEAARTNLGSNNFFMAIPFIKPLKKWVASKTNSKKTQEKLEVEKSILKQKQLFAQYTKSDLAKLKGQDERKLSPNQKVLYSPPPRMLRTRHSKQEKDKKKNLSSVKNEEKLDLNAVCKNNYPEESTSHEMSTNMDDVYFPISQTWKNVAIDFEAVIATFNLNIREMWPFKVL